MSVSVTDDQVTVRPARIAVGPEPDKQLPQNRDVEQPVVKSDAPLDIVVVAANVTDTDSRLEIRGGDRSVQSKRLVANGGVSLQTSLPTGVYEITAADIPGAEPAKLVVGPVRTSSENDLLLP